MGENSPPLRSACSISVSRERSPGPDFRDHHLQTLGNTRANRQPAKESRDDAIPAVSMDVLAEWTVSIPSVSEPSESPGQFSRPSSMEEPRAELPILPLILHQEVGRDHPHPLRVIDVAAMMPGHAPFIHDGTRRNLLSEMLHQNC